MSIRYPLLTAGLLLVLSALAHDASGTTAQEVDKTSPLLSKADKLFSSGKYAQACKVFEKAQDAAAGKSLDAALGLAQSHLQLGQPDEAYDNALRVVELAPDPETKTLGYLLVGTAAYHRARDLGEEGLYASKRRQQDRRRSRRDSLKEADAALKNALDLHPSNPLALIARTEVNLALNERGIARELIGKLPKEVDPRLEKAVINLRCLASDFVLSLDQPPAEFLKAVASRTLKKPTKLYAPAPRYTELARKQRWQGPVMLEAVIDEAGKIPCIRVVTGGPYGISAAALQNVKEWKFEPATMDGEPIPVKFFITVTYGLR